MFLPNWRFGGGYGGLEKRGTNLPQAFEPMPGYFSQVSSKTVVCNRSAHVDQSMSAVHNNFRIGNRKGNCANTNKHHPDYVHFYFQMLFEFLQAIKLYLKI